MGIACEERARVAPQGSGLRKSRPLGRDQDELTLAEGAEAERPEAVDGGPIKQQEDKQSKR